MDIAKRIAEELNIEKWQADAAIGLIEEGNTIPFIARYRKEVTGSLNDEVLRSLNDRLTYLKSLEEKKEQVLESIDGQGRLTAELKKKIAEAETMVEVEDLYRPYRPKRRTRAGIAREKGLEGLSSVLLLQKIKEPLENEAVKYLNKEKGVLTVEDAIAGAKDIIAEAISDEANYRTYIRRVTLDEGILESEAKTPGASSVYEMYYNFQEPVKKIAGHRVLALNRGEKEKVLTVKLTAPEDRILRYLEKKVIVRDNPYTSPLLRETAEDSYHRLIQPAIEREIRNELTEKAEDGAIRIFGKNLEQLLMQPPIAGKTVLGWDPAFRTGCKLAVVDATGKVLDTKVIFPTAPQNKVEEAKKELKRLIEKYHVDLISVGNGTASRESEQVIVSLIKELQEPVQYVIVNEAGASVYSASALATEEFPNFDVGQRSAASIARRLQDPLAELVKIDPQSIGVGQYQHDMNQKKLGDALAGVVEESVNKVGVDLNTASAPLLEHISGVSRTLAAGIVHYREMNGRFTNRRQLLKVPKLGPKAFEQCAGFMRISDGENPLDSTSVHPESYKAAEGLMKKLGLTMEDLRKLQKKAASEKNAGKPVQGSPAGRAAQGNPAERAAQGSPAGRAAQESPEGRAVSGSPAREKDFRKTAEESTTRSGTLDGKIADKKKTAEELGIGEITLDDILEELEKPARDPRESMPAPILRSDVMDIKDLKPGMVLKGTVRNVIDFGAFVDIGVHQDGLVHISQMSDHYIKHPLEAVSVGDIVNVKVLSVDPVKKRIALTMKLGTVPAGTD